MYACSRVNGADEDMGKHNDHCLRACVCARTRSKMPSVGMAPCMVPYPGQWLGPTNIMDVISRWYYMAKEKGFN